MEFELDIVNMILDHVDGPITAVNPAGLVLFANPAAERVLGWSYDEIVGTDFHSCIHDCPSPGADDCTLHSALITGKRMRSQDLFHCKDGTQVQLRYSASPMIYHDQALGTVITFCDAHDEPTQRARDEYIDLLAHDIQTPLTSLLGYANLLERRLIEHNLEREVGYAQMINHTAKHVSTLLRTIHTFSTHERTAEDHDLVRLATGCIRQLPEHERRRIALEAPPALSIRCSQISIERVLLNLLTNALKYTQPSTPIHVSLGLDGDSALISVADRGAGIAAADLARIFDKFYRTSDAKSTNGSGLGLYISKLIVESHGGRIWAESAPGQGSTFHVALPLDS